jgi:hypothetical protein
VDNVTTDARRLLAKRLIDLCIVLTLPEKLKDCFTYLQLTRLHFPDWYDRILPRKYREENV